MVLLHFVADQEYKVVIRVVKVCYIYIGWCLSPTLAIFQLYRRRREFIIETYLYRPRVKFFAMFGVGQHYLYSKHATKLMRELLGKTKKEGGTYEQNDSP
jgi:hypothetical protein